MPAVCFNRVVIERTHTSDPRTLGIHFDTSPIYNMQVESTKLRCEKGLSTLKTMAAKGMAKRHLFLLYQSVVLSVIDYSLGLTTLSQPSILKLDKVQNEAMRVLLGAAKDRPIEAMRYLLDLPQDTRWCKSKGIFMRCMQKLKNPLHDSVREEKGRRLARDKLRADQGEQSIQHTCGFKELK